MVSDQLMKILSKENAVKFSKLNSGNHFIPLYGNTPSWASANYQILVYSYIYYVQTLKLRNFS